LRCFNLICVNGGQKETKNFELFWTSVDLWLKWAIAFVLKSLPMPEEISVYQLSKFEEFAEVVELQKEIWGYSEIELLPLRFFIVANKIGGQVLGAFDRRKMVAFCICIPGLKENGKTYLHSHMLGVLPRYRNTGLGRQMKLKQRQYALAEDVPLIEWTFDPLEIKNAFFNIERLGAIIRRYVHNQYGTTTSHLHGGLPTDRLVPEWWVKSERAEAICSGRPYERPETLARISVPANIAEIRRDRPDEARDIQAGIASQFTDHFRQDLAVIGLEKSEEAGTYLLGTWESK
jgi:predicted GNAT superfamily acetyltransferase